MQPEPLADRIVVAVHGGAGPLTPGKLTPEEEATHRAVLAAATEAGYAVLAGGGSSLDAVEAAVVVLEDAPEFNAGHGAKMNADAAHELDASIMNGPDLAGGAVTGVRHVRNPVRLARLVMERSPHVMLAGDGAERFAAAHGVEPVTQDYFWTKRRWRSLRRAKRRTERSTRWQATFETVGAVALDGAGHLAAATSTGGQTGQLPGRVGDSPILGAGTWAEDGVAAISGTGSGELFIRLAVAHEIAARIKHGGMGACAAAEAVVLGELVDRFGAGTGGAIVLDPAGRLAAPFNTATLQAGWVTRDGAVQTRLYGDEQRADRSRGVSPPTS